MKSNPHNDQPWQGIAIAITILINVIVVINHMMTSVEKKVRREET